MVETRVELPVGRRVSIKTLERANELGFDFVCLTGNPGTGVSNASIAHSVRVVKEHFNGLVIAGKMHGAGVDEPVMTLEIAKSFIGLGVDILLVPAPYTVPHFQEQDLREICDYVYKFNEGKPIEEKVLVLAANGTSQDSCDRTPSVKSDLRRRRLERICSTSGTRSTGAAFPRTFGRSASPFAAFAISSP